MFAYLVKCVEGSPVTGASNPVSVLFEYTDTETAIILSSIEIPIYLQILDISQAKRGYLQETEKRKMSTGGLVLKASSGKVTRI